MKAVVLFLLATGILVAESRTVHSQTLHALKTKRNGGKSTGAADCRTCVVAGNVWDRIKYNCYTRQDLPSKVKDDPVWRIAESEAECSGASTEVEDRKRLFSIDGKSRGFFLMRFPENDAGQGQVLLDSLLNAADPTGFMKRPIDQVFVLSMPLALPGSSVVPLMHSVPILHLSGTGTTDEYLVIDLRAYGKSIIRKTGLVSFVMEMDHVDTTPTMETEKDIENMKTALLAAYMAKLGTEPFASHLVGNRPEQAKLQLKVLKRPVVDSVTTYMQPDKVDNVPYDGKSLKDSKPYGVALAKDNTGKYQTTVVNVMRWTLNYLYKHPHYFAVKDSCQRFAFQVFKAVSGEQGDYPNFNFGDAEDKIEETMRKIGNLFKDLVD